MKKRPNLGNEYLSFLDARKIARSLSLKNSKEWEFYSSHNRPMNIPSTPSRFYKNNGWVSWNDWLGTNNKKGFQHKRKYNVNDDFFKLFTGDMGYILGFWYADGWISKNRFCIIQHKNDKYILENILEKMESNNKLYSNKKHNCYSFEIQSSEIVKDIKLIGGMEKKSLTIKFPNIPDHILPDFIRGCWDGDGCITWNNIRKCYVSHYTCGSRAFIYTLLSKLKRNIKGLRGKIYKINNKNVYCLKFSKNNTILLKRFMYDNAQSKLMLIRKWEKFNSLGEICKVGSSHFKYLDYDSAKNIISGIGLKSCGEWREYSKLHRPSNIPSRPVEYYKNKGWVSWSDWLGRGV